MAKGVRGEGYPYSWSVYRWLDGEKSIGDLTEFAITLAAFLAAAAHRRRRRAGAGSPTVKRLRSSDA